jgi:tRNA 2-selenouridine synthase
MKYKVEKFLLTAKKIPIVDVRTPAEFNQGHIPGSFNIPLLSNEERVIVGTLYKKKGKDLAFIKALKYSGPNMADFVTKARRIAVNKKILVHCWRGGMRSSSMAWLFNAAGLEANILEGGYKAYRNHIRDSFAKTTNIVVLGGFTGSGKTEILQYLSKTHKVIDLEKMAHHKGSAFGFIGQKKQPTTEQFENNLGEKWLNLNGDNELWLEDESRNIGSVYLPEIIYDKIRNSQVIFIDLPKEERIKRLVKEYSGFDNELIKISLNKIHKRIGGQNHKIALSALKENDFYTIAKISLTYYDKAYIFGLNKRNIKKVYKIKIEKDNPDSTAKIISDFYKKEIKK